MKKEKHGGFLIRNCHVGKQKEFSLQNREKMMERLVLYKNVEYIRTSLKKDHYVDFIVNTLEDQKKGKPVLEYLSKRAYIGTLVVELPDYFIQINQSEVINAFQIVGRSKSYLFTKSSVLKISKLFQKEANYQLHRFYDSSYSK